MTQTQEKDLASSSSSSSVSKVDAGARNKDELFWKVLDAALKLDITQGHLRWKMTDLSRSSGVTRSLIYYYFGHSKRDILQAAIDIMGQEFFGLSDERQSLWDNGRIWESVQRTRALVKNTPYIPIFFLNQRQPGSPFHRQFQELEKRYIQKISTRFPKINAELLPGIYATLFGLVTIADLSEANLQAFILTLMKGLDQAS